jgi:hypothetical protein
VIDRMMLASLDHWPAAGNASEIVERLAVSQPPISGSLTWDSVDRFEYWSFPYMPNLDELHVHEFGWVLSPFLSPGKKS